MQRPTAVTVFGVLNILYALFAMGSTVLGLASLKLLKNYVPEAAQQAELTTANIVGMVISMIIAVGLLVDGIGLMAMRRWARKLAVWIGGALICQGIVGIAMMPSQMQAASQRQGAMGQEFLAVSMVVGVFVTLVMMTYPILMMIFLTRRPVVEAFAPPAESPTML